MPHAASSTLCGANPIWLMVRAINPFSIRVVSVPLRSGEERRSHNKEGRRKGEGCLEASKMGATAKTAPLEGSHTWKRNESLGRGMRRRFNFSLHVLHKVLNLIYTGRDEVMKNLYLILGLRPPELHWQLFRVATSLYDKARSRIGIHKKEEYSC